MRSKLQAVRSTITTLSGTAALITISVLSSQAFAGPAPDPIETRASTVNLDGLDLSQPSGLAIAHERIRRTAVHLCEGVLDERSLSQHAEFLQCVANSLAAVEPKLARLASARSPATRLASVQP